VRVGLNHHGHANFAAFDALPGSREFWIKAAHEADLQQHLVAFHSRVNRIAFL